MALSKIKWIKDGFAPFLEKVQSHHVFNFCMDYVERADVCIISSFAINEGFVRRLIKNKESLGQITMLWDANMAQSNIKNLLFLTKNIHALYLNSNHSKVMYMANKSRQCVAVSSVNTTGNYRYEGGFITSDPILVNYYKTQLDEIISTSTKWTNLRK